MTMYRDRVITVLIMSVGTHDTEFKVCLSRCSSDTCLSYAKRREGRSMCATPGWSWTHDYTTISYLVYFILFEKNTMHASTQVHVCELFLLTHFHISNFRRSKRCLGYILHELVVAKKNNLCSRYIRVSHNPK